jgi:RNA polymerase sigma-70 factor (ECF subfamily)
MNNFNEIYEDNHRIVLSYVSQKLNDYTLAEEITNDVFIKLSNCLDSFNEEKASMRTWIMTFAKNAVIDQYRKRKLETISLFKNTVNSGTDENTFQSVGDKLICKIQTPYEALNSKEKMSTIENAIADLSKTDFEVAYYFFTEELSYAEISEVMNISLGTVKGKISRARKSLQAKLVTI